MQGATARLLESLNADLEVVDMLTGLTFRLRLIPFAVIALLLSIPLAVTAQVTTATMVGTVTDPGGSKVPARK
jgi:hypothetical protein